MTREEAIKHLHNDWFKALGGQICVDGDRAEQFLEAVGMAISALRTQSDPFERQLKRYEIKKKENPLTLDELRGMDGEPVWLVDLVHKSDPKVPDLWGGWIVFTKHDQNGFIPRGGGFFSNDGYGKNWLAYRRKPEEGNL